MDRNIVKLMRIQSASASEKCCFCDKRVWEVSSLHHWIIDYKKSPNWKWGDTREEYTCLKCGNEIKEKFAKETEEIRQKNEKERELLIKEKVNNCFAELKELREELEKKIENEHLTATDCQRIFALKSKITQILTEKGIENFSDYWMAEADFDLLKESINDLDKLTEEYASPQNQNKAINKTRWKSSRSILKIKDPKCFHRKITSFDDNLSLYRCSYCWETDDPKFLKRLQHWHISNINKRIRENNISTTQFVNNLNYSKLSSDTFTSQEELKRVYQQTEKDLHLFLKDKGIDINNKDHSRERERERELACLTVSITLSNCLLRIQSH